MKYKTQKGKSQEKSSLKQQKTIDKVVQRNYNVYINKGKEKCNEEMVQNN